MDGVDKFDKIRALHTTERFEKRVPVSSCTFLLDGSIQNGYAVCFVLRYPRARYYYDVIHGV